MIDLRELDGLDPGVHAAQPDGRQVDRRQPAVVETDDQLIGRIVHGQRRRPRCGDDADGGPRPKVLGPDLGPGREVDALAGAIAGEDVLPPMLDGGGADRCPDVAGALDVVAAPQHDPGRHRVLGEVRVGPLVDVVRLVVAPGLQELRCGPRVVDLVEVHLVGLGEAERSHPERGQQQHGHDPDVEAIEAATALARPGSGCGRHARDAPSTGRGSSPRRRSRSATAGRPRSGWIGIEAAGRRGCRVSATSVATRSSPATVAPLAVAIGAARADTVPPRSPARSHTPAGATSAGCRSVARTGSGSRASSSSSVSRARPSARTWTSAHTNDAVCISATIVTVSWERRSSPIPSQSRTGLSAGSSGA